MNIFNSLGSNYDISYVIKSLILQEKGAQTALISYLEHRYKKTVVLHYKARQALEQGLLLLKLPKDSKVAITGFTCVAVVDAIKKANLTPVFVDIDKNSLNFTAGGLKNVITKEKNIRAVIIQNTLGISCDIEEIQSICKKNKLILIEDLAHSIGVYYENGKETGTVGDLVILSFSQDKVVDSVSGGALLIKNASLKEQHVVSKTARFQDRYYPLFTYLTRKTYPFEIGKILHTFFKITKLLANPMIVNELHMTDWHAILALEGLRTLDNNISHRKKIVTIYKNNLPKKYQVSGSSILRFPIILQQREELVELLKKNNVYISDIWYETPIAPKKYFAKSGYRIGECPISEKIAGTILNLPTHKNVSEKDALRICHIIQSWER